MSQYLSSQDLSLIIPNTFLPFSSHCQGGLSDSGIRHLGHVELSPLDFRVSPQTWQLFSGVDDQDDRNDESGEDILHEEDPDLLEQEDEVAGFEGREEVDR